MSGSFEKTNFGWQLQQLGRQVSEGIQWELSRLFSNLPNFPRSETTSTPWLEEFTFWVLLGMGGVFLVWLTLKLWVMLRPYLEQLLQEQRLLTTKTSPPIAPQLTVAGWLQQAQEMQRQGNYREACRSLYMALLQKLDEAQVIPQQASRTDGEYLQQIETLYVRSRLSDVAPYRTLILTHEQLCFGNTEISDAEFRDCQQAYQEIHSPSVQ